ncbi:FAS1-like dehydratase domain-containing protein [Streptomyces krungchingensis]
MDADIVGKTSPSFTMLVELGKVREFVRAVGATDSTDSPDETPCVLPTFLCTQDLWHDESADPIAMSGLDVTRGLHAEQEFVFFGRPPRVGSRLTCATRVEEVFRKTGRRGGDMTFMVAVTEFRDEEGHLVAESRKTSVELGEGHA